MPAQLLRLRKANTIYRAVKDSKKDPNSYSTFQGKLNIENNGKNRRKISVKIEVEAPLDAVLNKLIGFEKLADFIPRLALCQLLERRENYARLYQANRVTLLREHTIKL
ncbi:hypothetical protein SUGI_0899340 [Cryptomeria japonica]|nr:hypothetical protein SUGI_0899340 [Cryptomeria japonica]